GLSQERRRWSLFRNGSFFMTYRINPYISFVESRLFPHFVEHAVFHRLTGDLLQSGDSGQGFELSQLIQKQFLIPEGYDPLAPLLDHYVIRPIQNPAVAHRSKTEEWILVRTSMEHTVYSRKRDELPPIIEEKLSPLTADILLMADGSKTLRQIFTALRSETNDAGILEDSEFRGAIDFL